MVLTIAAFELRKRLAMISSYVYVALFFACGLLSMLAAGGAFSNVSAGAGTEKVLANSPTMINGFIILLSNLGVIVSAAVFGQAIHQDFESRTDSIFFTTPVRKSSYVGGRFLGASIFTVVIFASISVGLLLASLSPVLVERSFFGPTRLGAYFWPYLTLVVPNVLVTGALFFSLATLTRRMMPVYVGAVVLAIGYIAASALAGDVENKTLAALIDPFGGHAINAVTRYWTTADKNSLLVPLTGLLLWNRLLWLGVGVAIFAFTYSRFKLAYQGTTERRGATAEASEAFTPVTELPKASLEHRSFSVVARLSWLGFVETVKNTYFAVIVLAGGILTLLVVHFSGRLSGTPTYPVTYRVAGAAEGGFALFMLILLTFYAGEIVWRERDANMDQIVDALPIPTWVPYVAKLLSLIMVVAVLLVCVMLFGIAYQTSQGYFHYELGLYLKWFFGVAFPGYVFLCVLAIAVQSVIQNKYLGHFAMVAFYVFGLFQDKLGLQHRLFKYGSTPEVTYSDMNGFGHFIRPLAWYDLYWAGVALLVAIVGDLFWSRGVEASFKVRTAIARTRLTPSILAMGALGLLIAGGAGGLIYYNTCVLNHFRTDKAQEQLRADYEKKYKPLASKPQPRITDVKVDFDIFPETETLIAHGSYTLENKSGKPVDTVYVTLPSEQPIQKLSVGGVAQPTEQDSVQGFYTFKLPTPLPAGERMPLAFELVFHDKGFKENGNRTDIAANGTFFNSQNLPHIGYDEDSELERDNVRKKYDLPPKERMRDLNDPEGLKNNLISHDADWITFESTVSTSPDQTAIVPGYLDKEWVDNGRRYFHYKMDSKILDFYSVLSGRYEVRRDKWNEVNLEVYYHPAHTYDLDDMMRGMKEALSYASANFGPYQHRQARIIEFPRYATFAQSFPNTIPYSEAIGFISKVNPNDPEDVHFPLFVTAHEIGHQWWAHQVIGARVQGVSMLDETLAEYTGMMVMKKVYGPSRMKRFLKYELDRYLQGRAMEQKKELPLMRVENQQYIHYSKGGVVMFALQDYIGENKVNEALASFLAKTKLAGPPYPTTVQLVDEFKKVTPPEMQYLIHDFFETITLYDNRAESAVAHKRADGKYDVTVKVSTKKMQADDQGKEKEVPVNDLIDVGAVDDKGEVIFRQKRKLKAGTNEFTFTVDALPAKAGLDPLVELVDRHPDDNVVAVTLK